MATGEEALSDSTVRNDVATLAWMVGLWATVRNARTQAEIQANLDQSLTGVEAGLAGYMEFLRGYRQ